MSRACWIYPSAIRSNILAFVAVQQFSGTAASLIAFGNSYSDAGQGANVAVHASLGITQQNSDYFPSPPYYQGHFSNGPIWLETAAASLSDVLHSYAAGAAVTGAPGTASNLLVYPPYADITSVVDVAVPTGLQQAQEFLNQNGGVARPQSTYILELGVNDYLNVVSGAETVTVNAIIDTIKEIMQNLYNAGARKFIVLNVPPFAGTPILLPPFTPANESAAAQAEATSLTTAHNAALPTMISCFNASNPGAEAMIYDIDSFFVNLITNAAKEGFTVNPLTTPCYTATSFFPGFTAGDVACSDPDQHIFWDSVHLTKHANDLLAQSFVATFPELSDS